MRAAKLITAFLLTIATALPAAAQQLSLGEISSYLNQLDSAQGSFTQINADGTISTGTVSIQRPGKVRFDYNPPEQALVMANNGTVVVFDRKVNAAPETYPLSQTPLSIILAADVNLGQAGMVTRHEYDGTATIVTAQDPRNPQYGNIQMKFTGNPVELRQWVINDSNGSSTTVVLGGLERRQVASGLFNIRGEMAKRD
ncbi:LolA family protein [Roseivivax isoporae]|uniref:Cell envelope biogenesis protein LolA n=1 Tax=Roseivivax isoporae LMG 25204 TaxID=1449351 RepID=X7FAX7_9RHOB|nr:outer membrane lipoprotein carrier protein LolA [Roseivivax isoporae]ETX30017.1 cell envelope biogenesis protein LolA [Roseivivax isoporae LMG 25204]